MPLIDYSNFLDKILPEPKYKKSFRNAKQSYLNRMRWAVTMFYFGMGYTFASWAGRIPDIKSNLDLSEAELGTILFAIPIGQLIALPISGKTVTKFGSIKISIISLLLYVASLCLLGLSQVSWQLALSLVLFGIAGNFCNISVNTQGVYAEGLFPKPIMGSFHGSWSLAGFFGALTGMGMNAFGFSPAVHFGFTAFIVCLLVLFNYKYLVKAKPRTDQPKAGFFATFGGVLIWLGVIAFCCRTSEGVMYDWSGVYFREVVNAKGALAMVGYSAFMITMTCGRFLSDKLVAKFGRRRILITSGVTVSLGLACSVAFPFLIPATFSFMLVGIGVSMIFPIVFSIAGSNPDVPTSAALTVVTSVSFLGFLTGPPVIGYIAEQSSLRYSFAFVAIFGVAISILVKFVKDIR
ncbi:MFS transporter [Flavobacterium sp. MAH-1]|uniref:MFS transporter n=1 Tax=Flavobacterium agri TaxID=2743471 RepID=A0A7Y8Y261_9FLAO|nr:MFS transporter [Flavobacterium agri]NUY81067.1 MFS transporter [Flavobacterium agri]NYA71091.1 MFS transporter [Flavobacterium agri]